MHGATVKDVPAQIFITTLAEHFKKSSKLELPEWHDIIKTACYKELPPQDPDWYYIRAASMIRKIYLHGGIGVGAFTKIYGGSQNNGSMPAHFRKAARGSLRHILLQLESQNLIAKKDKKKGRFITKEGQRELDTIAIQIAHPSTKSN